MMIIIIIIIITTTTNRTCIQIRAMISLPTLKKRVAFGGIYGKEKMRDKAVWMTMRKWTRSRK